MNNDLPGAAVPEQVDVKAVRERTGLSQSAFAARFGLSVSTLQNWEQGLRRPDPAVRAYLTAIGKAPEVVAELWKGTGEKCQ